MLCTTVMRTDAFAWLRAAEVLPPRSVPSHSKVAVNTSVVDGINDVIDTHVVPFPPAGRTRMNGPRGTEACSTPSAQEANDSIVPFESTERVNVEVRNVYVCVVGGDAIESATPVACVTAIAIAMMPLILVQNLCTSS